MKGGILLVLAMLIFVKPASAQEIVIGQKAYPLTILIPLIIIAFIWAIIMVVYLFKNMHKFSWVLVSINRRIKKAGLQNLPEYFKGLIKRKKGEEGEAKKEKAEKEEDKKDLSPYLKRLDVLEARLPKISNTEALHEFSDITRDFFSDLVGLRHAFTIEEVRSKLKTKRKELLQIAERVSEAKYSGSEITKEETLVMMDRLRKITESYVHKGWKKERKAQKFLDRLIEEDKKIISNIRDYLDVLKHENRKKQIEGLLDDERALLKRNISTIKRVYNKILALYVQLSPKEREKIYPKLMEFYNNVNKAMFSTVYGERSMKKLEYFSKKLEELKNKPKVESINVKIRKLIGAKRVSPMREIEGQLPERKIPVKRVKPQPVEVAPDVAKLKRKELKVIKKFGKVIKRDKEAAKDRLKIREAVRLRKERLAGREINLLEKINRITSAPPPMERVDYKAKVNALINKATWALNKHRIHDVKKFYSQLKPYYMSLGEVEKKAIYPRIATLHSNIVKVMEGAVAKKHAAKKKKVAKKVSAKKIEAEKKAREEEREKQKEAERLAYEEKELQEKLNMLRRGL